MNVDLFTVRIGLPIGRMCLLPKNAFINIYFAWNLEVLSSQDSRLFEQFVYFWSSCKLLTTSFKTLGLYIVRTSKIPAVSLSRVEFFTEVTVYSLHLSSTRVNLEMLCWSLCIRGVKRLKSWLKALPRRYLNQPSIFLFKQLLNTNQFALSMGIEQFSIECFRACLHGGRVPWLTGLPS